MTAIKLTDTIPRINDLIQNFSFFTAEVISLEHGFLCD